MRTTIFALATSALLLGGVVVGCGGSKTTTITKDGGSTDGAIKPTGDLATDKGTLACSEYVDCYANCAKTSADQPSYNTCTGVCDGEAKSTVVSTDQNKPGLFDTAAGCTQIYCITGSATFTQGDGAVRYKCGVDSSGHFTEADGSPLPGAGSTAASPCIDCINASGSTLYGFPCKDATSTDCASNTSGNLVSVCGAQINACLNNK
jgi:hypothetical protein